MIEYIKAGDRLYSGAIVCEWYAKKYNLDQDTLQKMPESEYKERFKNDVHRFMVNYATCDK